MPWREDVLTVPAFRSVIEKFLSAPRWHSSCFECCNTELQNTRYLMRFLMCSTDLAGRLVYEEERPAHYVAATSQTETVRFVRLEECSRLNEGCFIRLERIRSHIEEHARRQIALDGGDWTPRMKGARLLGYIQGHSECVGNPMDFGHRSSCSDKLV